MPAIGPRTPFGRHGSPTTAGSGDAGRMPDDRRSPKQQRWSWDPSLYAGSAGHYVVGRVPYPPGVAQTLVDRLGLDGAGILLDVGCGPGSLTLLLAPYVAEAIGVDADADMLTAAASIASRRGIQNVRWKHLRAEQLPDDLPSPCLITLAQSFHWMDRPRVARTLREMLEPGGALVHVSATTHWGAEAEHTDRPGAPPWRAIETLVATYLGSDRRAGQGTRGAERDDEDTIYSAAGFAGPHRLEVPGWTVERSRDDVVAAVHSLSWAAPHLFGDRLTQFDSDLNRLLADAMTGDTFPETMRPVVLDIWR